MNLYRYIFEIEVPDETEESRIIEYQKAVIDKLQATNKRLKARVNELEQTVAYMEWED